MTLEREVHRESLGDYIGLVLDRFGDGITIQGPSGELVYANESGARLCGFDSADELMRAPVAEVIARFELYDEEGRPFPVAELPGRRALRGEYPPEALIQVRTKTSAPARWSVVQALPVRNATGDVLYAVNVFRDVTERVEAARRQRVLVEAGDLLASGLGDETMLPRLAALTVPALADACDIYLVDEQGGLSPPDGSHAEVARLVIGSGEPASGTGPSSFVVVPIPGRERVLGALALSSRESGRVLGEADLTLALDLGRRAGLALDNSALLRASQEATCERERLLASEQEARAAAEVDAQSLQKLENITQAALAHVSGHDLLDTLLREITVVLAADTSVLLLLDDEHRYLTVHASHGFDREIEEAVPIPYGRGMAGRVAASGEAVVIRDLDEVELASPHLRRRGIASLVAIPLRADGQVIGVAHVGSVERTHFSERDMRLFELMADRLSLALVQLRLFEAEREARLDAERAQRRLSFLAEASTILASSLDYEETLQAVARLVVPDLAEWCAVHVVSSEGALELIAVAHATLTPEQLAGLRPALLRGDPSDPVGPSAVVRAGTPELVPDAGTNLRAIYGGDSEGVAALERLGFVSYMCVPMHGRDRELGAIVFGSGAAEGRFQEGDLALAEELARRTAVAVENALLFRDSEERGRAARVLAAVADGVFLVDAEGVIRLWNPAAEAITGLAAADVLNLPAPEAIPGWEAVVPRIPVGADLGAATAQAETVPLEIRDRELWLSISGVGFADGTVYAFRDLTQERALEELKGEFVSTVSHELRTPLAAIYGAAMTLRRPDIAEDTLHNVKLIDMIVEESERLATIVNDILLASRLDSAAVRLQIESFDAAALARGVVESAGLHRPEGIELDVSGPEDLPLVAGDPEKTRQVLVNLVDNAVKYSPDGGRVEIELSADGGSVLFAVHDEGLGVPAAEQRRIFEKFYRLDPNMRRGVGGTGLGLYICRELVQRMGGRLWVVSPRTGGKGSTFAFELPLAGRS